MPAPRQSQVRRTDRRINSAARPGPEPRATPVEPPEPNEHWAPAALAWYESLSESYQSQYFEPSDWQLAWFTAHLLSQVMRRDRPSAVMVAQVASMMESLGSSARARATAGLVRPPEAAPSNTETLARLTALIESGE